MATRRVSLGNGGSAFGIERSGKAMAVKGMVHLDTKTLTGSLPIKTWKELRDEDEEKQDLDMSCGAAATATISAVLLRLGGLRERCDRRISKGGYSKNGLLGRHQVDHFRTPPDQYQNHNVFRGCSREPGKSAPGRPR